MSNEGAPGAAPAGAARTETGLYLYGVVRASGWRPWRGGDEEGVQRVRYRDLAALVRPAPFELPALDRQVLLSHQRAVEQAMRRHSILPAPAGVVFRGRRPLIRFLEDQYVALDEGLAFVENHWELRLHITPAREGEPDAELADSAARLYAELRRGVRAAIPFPRSGRRLLSAAFLVDRGSWAHFVERAHDLGAQHPGLVVDVTGPWPPYDFVKMVV
ncbi:MAG: GvpL/GvpF family gas vesicle protein [bacterium]|jgi:hypothetical protein|nr:MAG: hypothetical protein DIU52_11040 [bacterium]